MSVREFIVERAYAEALYAETRTDPVSRVAVNRTVLLDEPGRKVFDVDVIPTEFRSLEELESHAAQQSPLPGADECIANSYAQLGVPPPEYVQ